MPVYVHHIETLVPENAYSQEFAAEWMKSRLDGDKQRRLVNRVYGHSGIGTRHSVLPDFRPEAADPLFKIGPDGKLLEPSTRDRNERFAQEAKRMSVEVARSAIERYPLSENGRISEP